MPEASSAATWSCKAWLLLVMEVKLEPGHGVVLWSWAEEGPAWGWESTGKGAWQGRKEVVGAKKSGEGVLEMKASSAEDVLTASMSCALCSLSRLLQLSAEGSSARLPKSRTLFTWGLLLREQLPLISTRGLVERLLAVLPSVGMLHLAWSAYSFAGV